MKKLILLILLVWISVSATATIYYISPNGNDANSGLTEGLAKQTISAVNGLVLSAGDQVLFERNGSWYGALTVNYSGTSGNPITFGAYGTGTNPIISGFSSITAWTNLGSNIWESTNAVSTLSTLNMVLIGGVNTPMGRFPNSGYFFYQSHSDNYHITSSYLSGTPNWTGAELAMNVNEYNTYRCAITAQSSGTLTYIQPESFSIKKNGQKFIIQNDIRTLDQQNEWYYNPTTKKISIYSTSQPSDVKVSSIDILVGCSKSYVIFDGINFEGSNSKTFSVTSSNYLTIQNCNISYSGQHGIYGGYGTGAYLTVLNCVMSDSNNGAIGLTSYFTNALISGNTVTKSGMIYGATRYVYSGQNNSGIGIGISAQGSGSIIEYNIVTNSGYIGIYYLGNNVTVQNNYIYKFNQNQHDGGGLYTWNGSNTSYAATQVLNNIIINELVNTDEEDGTSGKYDGCIYLDNYSNGITISGNTMANSGIGLFLINSHEVTVSDNVIYNNDKGIRYYTLSGSAMANISVTGNKIVAKKASQNVIYASELEDIEPYLIADYNIYARPIDDNITFNMSQVNPSPITYNINFETWQSTFGQDTNGRKSPQSISLETDIQFEYNNTASPITIGLIWPAINLFGTKYVGTIEVPAWGSIILLKDANPAPNPNPGNKIHGGKMGSKWGYHKGIIGVM